MIISVSGKIGSGKDTVGKIIQIITDNPHFTDKAVEDWLGREILNPKFQNKKWADALKDIVCRLINCTREQLEDREFKEKELPEEWTMYGYASGFIHGGKAGDVTMNYQACSKERYEEELRINWQTAYKQVMTPRLLLQYIGTNLFRDKLLANIWVNSLMSEYKSIGDTENFKANWFFSKGIKDFNALKQIDRPRYQALKQEMFEVITGSEPNWVITDTRFPNELKAIKDKGGISIKVIRPCGSCKFEGTQEEWDKLVEKNKQAQHESETALDNAEFDETIINDGSILDLIGKVREILTKRGIINN